MLSTDAFNYVNVLDKAADASWSRENILTNNIANVKASDASWSRNSVISNNIANVDTPGYKRKDLNFENTLKTELGRCKHESLDSKMKDVDLSRLNPSVYVDSSNYSYRLDGSNVDIDTEGLLLITNDGELCHRLLSPKHHVDKCYFAKTDLPIPADAVKKFEEGIDLGDFTSMPAKLEIIGRQR